jgi:cullin 3
MVINKFGGRLYDGLVAAVSSHLEGVAARLADANGEALLRGLKEAWDRHCKSMQMVRDILMVR